LAFALYLPWWPTLLGIVTRRPATGGAEAGVGSPAAFLVEAIHSLGPAPGWSAWLFLGLWAVGLARLIRRRPALALFGGLWLALPLALPFVFRDPRALHLRYAFLLPVYLLFVAQGVLVTGGWGLGAGRQQTGDSPQKVADGKQRIGYWPSPISLLPALCAPLLALLGLVLVSVLYLPGYYRRAKPDWRGAGAYLTARTAPGDVIVTGPLFDVGRYLGYYYHGPAELMPPALLVSTLPDRVISMRASGGRVWVVTRFPPNLGSASRPVAFAGLTVSEPMIPVYEPEVLTEAMIELMQQAVAAAPQWAAEMSAERVLDPDPLVARAAAYLFLGDTLRAAGRLPEAVAAYEAMVADNPTAAGGYATLAEAYAETGQMAAAAKAYQQAVALNPTWQGPAAEAAASLAEAGRWAEAVAAYREVVK